MAAPDLAQIKKITDNLEASYQSLNRAALSLTTLVRAGRATCDEVRVYNLYALSMYASQRGMLSALRAAGEPNVPALPPNPTLFAWKGISGAQAYNVTCDGKPGSLSGLMGRVLKGPADGAVYVSSDQINVERGAPPSDVKVPSLAALVQAQAASGLGNPIVLIVIIAAIAVTISVGLYALFSFLTENAIQVETSDRMRVSSAAYEKFIGARAACVSQCLTKGESMVNCVAACDSLIPKPNLIVDSARGQKGLTFTQILGWGAVGIAGFWAWSKIRGRRDDLPAAYAMVPSRGGRRL